jgi:hypothetical protein
LGFFFKEGRVGGFNGHVSISHFVSIVIFFYDSKFVGTLIICELQYLMMIILHINVFVEQGLIFDYVYVQQNICVTI